MKSPAKDFGVNERIVLGREKIISSFDRWSLAQNNGEQCVAIIHNMKEKARRSGDTPYPNELETYCKKLEVIKTVFEDVISSAAGFRKEVVGSISIFESLRDNEELKEKLITVQNFLENLLKLYESSLELKQFIVGKLSHFNFDFLILCKLLSQRTSLTQLQHTTQTFSSPLGAAIPTKTGPSGSLLN